MSSIGSADSVEFTTIAITQNKATQNDYSQEEYKRLDDVILVNFTDPAITETEVNDFMSRNYIELVHAPSTTLPSATWTYLFRISPEYSNTFQACRFIFNSEQGFVTRCIPNIVGLFEPGSCQPVSEFSDFENTSAKDALWHIRNRGNAPVGGLGNGKDNADANICECWGEGYHGEGVKVVDIDFGGFDYTHPDMQGQFLEGYDLINSVTPHNSSFWDTLNPEGHGMAVSGAIAAKANSAGQYSAVGVAYNSKIIPMLTSGSIGQITLGIQKAVEVGADIVNISFGQYFGLQIEDSIISKNNIYKCVEYNSEDSVMFFSEYTNGHYWIYNKNGQVVKRNAYTSGLKGMPQEFTVHFIYDNEGRNIMMLWYDTTWVGDISRVRIEEFDSLGNNFGFRDFSGVEKYPDAYKTRNHFKTDHPDPHIIVDSVISKTKKEYFHFLDEDRIDTIEHKIKYYSNHHIDSNIVFYKQKKYSEKSIDKFSYHQSETLKEYESKYYKDGKIKSIDRTIFLENGLPKEKWYVDYYGERENITHTKFIYEYY